MKLRLTEKQINKLVLQITENQEVKEQDSTGTDSEAAKPTAGTSSQQSGGKGYPEVGKWESGITRGPANQLGVTKWSDIVGGNLKRGKANQLKEQSGQNVISKFPSCVAGETSNKNRGELKKSTSGQDYIEIYIMGLKGYKFYSNGRVSYPNGKMGNYSCKGNDILVDGKNIGQENWNKIKGNYTTDWEKQEYKKATEFGDRFGERVINPVYGFYQKYNHEVNMVLGLGLAVAGGPFGLAMSSAIGFLDAAQYEEEGDEKTASLVRLFSAIPLVGGVVGKLVPGASKLGPKVMGSLGKMVGMGKPLSQEGAEVVLQISKNRALIQKELNRLGQEALKKKGIDVSIPAARKALETKLRNQTIKKGLKYTAGTIGAYGGLIYGHDKAYDYLERKKEEENLRILNQKLGIKD